MCAVVLYLKTLLSLCLLCSLELFDCVHVPDLSRTSDYIYKQYLRWRTLPFEDCGSKYDILYLNISSCNTIPCVMPRGSKVTVNVIFDDEGNNISFLKHRVRWVFNSVKTDAIITPDPCDGYHDCIMNSTDGKSYWAAVYVNNNLPIIGGSMIWEAGDEHDNDVLCFKVPVAICQ